MYIIPLLGKMNKALDVPLYLPTLTIEMELANNPSLERNL